MKKNVGGYDRIGRLTFGMLLLIVGIGGIAVGRAGGTGLTVGPVPQTAAAAVLALIGAGLIVTGHLQTCPINRTLGIDTLGGTPLKPGN